MFIVASINVLVARYDTRYDKLYFRGPKSWRVVSLISLYRTEPKKIRLLKPIYSKETVFIIIQLTSSFRTLVALTPGLTWCRGENDAYVAGRGVNAALVSFFLLQRVFRRLYLNSFIHLLFINPHQDAAIKTWLETLKQLCGMNG